MARTFIAIEFDEQVKLWLQDKAQTAQKLDTNGLVRWVHPQNMHLTLQFLGEQPSEMIRNVSNDLRESLLRVPGCKLELSGVGAFPTNRSPRVVWLNVLNSGKLKDLAETVRVVCRGHGVRDEQGRFQPHITLGRVRESTQRDAAAALMQQIVKAEADQCWGVCSQVVKSVTIFKSELKPNGPVYTKLESFRTLAPEENE